MSFRTFRRGAVVLTIASLTALTAAGVLALTGCSGAPAVSTVGAVPFERPLAIPPLAPSQVVDGVRVFDLTRDLNR